MDFLADVACTKNCAKCQTTKLISEFGKNAARKDGVQTYCQACTKQYMAAKSYDKDRWANCKEQESARNKGYRLEHSERLKSQYVAKAEKRRKTHAADIRRLNIARKHGIRQATPAWADMAAMNEIYQQAKSLELQDGIRRHVDHEIPLKGRLVSGLHVQNNLQILTAEENMRKHNAFDLSNG